MCGGDVRPTVCGERAIRRTRAQPAPGGSPVNRIDSRGGDMESISWETAPVEFAQEGLAETRTLDAGGMTVAFERICAGFDTRPFFTGLPDDCCQSPHWGYVLQGSFRVVSAGSEQVIEAGQAYYLSPGHNIVVDESCKLVEFSPAEQRRKTMEHAEKTAAAAGY
jgi:hypothetical protein